MKTSSAAPATSRLTRRSGMGVKGWLLPFAVLLPGILVTILAVTELDRAYRRDAGVVRLQQLLPYGLMLRYSDHSSTDPVDTATRLRMERRWLGAAQPVADDVAAISWRERSGIVVVVLAARSDSPPEFVDALLATPSGRVRIRAWPEGERVAMLLVVAKGDSAQDVDRVISAREQSVRSSVGLLRAASLTASAAAPPILLVVALFILLVPFLLVFVPIPFLFSSPVLLRARRHARRLVGARPSPAGSSGAGGTTGIAPGGWTPTETTVASPMLLNN